MNILGISALYHDSAAAICVDGEIVAAAQEERFSRVKHDSSFPVKSIDYCMKESGVNPYKLDAVVYYDNPLLTLDRWLSNIVELGNDSNVMIEKSFDTMFSKKLWVHRFAEKTLGCLGRKHTFMTTKHHVAHAASAFFPSPFEDAAILTMDGVGEWTTTALGVGHGNNIELIREINYPHSLGLLYSAFTYFCGFKVNSGDYKLMGLAPYGEPKYCNIIKKELIDIKADGSYRLNLHYFDYQRNTMMTNEAFSALFGGPPRTAESKITKREMDLAASIQTVLEEIVLKLGRTVREITEMRNLVMAGGVALNCVANGKLLREKIFDNIWIQPAAGDAGGALGAALYATYQYFGFPRNTGKKRDNQKGSYLGPSFTNAEVSSYLDGINAKYKYYANKKNLYRIVAENIASGKVVGFFNGRMEFGPRALGARSILADPRNPLTQSKMNLKIKYRESFRPFAPSVLVEKAADYFELDCESPYMLICADVCRKIRKKFDIKSFLENSERVDMLPIINEVRSEIPAVTHINYSARVQTVNREDNPDYYLLISEFEALTGCAVVVNTSFNVRGEPIVCTPEDAYRCFMRTEMEMLVIENFILYKEDQAELFEDIDWKEQFELD